MLYLSLIRFSIFFLILGRIVEREFVIGDDRPDNGGSTRL
jgi:hypothetical protein